MIYYEISFLPVRAFISIEIIAIEIKLVRRTLTKCRLKPYGLNCCAGSIFSIDIEALTGKGNSENKFQAKSFVDHPVSK
ncbi:MAG: hypothetical protein LBT09_05950 [Planctomycetaceae bacterium]|jgi:hypothetical protein|nr:hypothetical protein [Planctomycetaceae bacterium]